jgi:hypothetical protein
MEDRFNKIIDSMDNALEQNPSYFFKDKVLNVYFASKERIEKKMTDWFPWIKPEFQMTFMVIIIATNILSFSYYNKMNAYKNDVAVLAKTFNSGSNE